MATLDYRTTCELNRPVTIKHLDGMFFSQDVQANRIVVSVVRGGVNEDLSGTVSANIIRADGGTVVQAGEIDGNVVTVTMPAAAYAIPGAIAVFVKHTQSGVTSTIAAVTGYVYKSTTDTIVDPGTIIPSIQDLLESIDDAIEDLEEAIAAIPQDYQDLENEVDEMADLLIDEEEDEYNLTLIATEKSKLLDSSGNITAGIADTQKIHEYTIAEGTQSITLNVNSRITGEAKYAIYSADTVAGCDQTTALEVGTYTDNTDKTLSPIPNGAKIIIVASKTVAKMEGATRSVVSKADKILDGMTTATESDEGKTLIAKTVTGGKVVEWEFGDAGPQVDETLSVEGDAADAKAVGDLFDLVVTDKKTKTYYASANVVDTAKEINADGSIVSSAYTNLNIWGIAIDGTKTGVGFNVVNGNAKYIAFYTAESYAQCSSSTFISKVQYTSSADNEVEFPENATYCLINYRTFNSGYLYLDEKVSVASNDIDAYKDELNTKIGNSMSFADLSTFSRGKINSNGSIDTLVQYKCVNAVILNINRTLHYNFDNTTYLVTVYYYDANGDILTNNGSLATYDARTIFAGSHVRIQIEKRNSTVKLTDDELISLPKAVQFPTEIKEWRDYVDGNCGYESLCAKMFEKGNSPKDFSNAIGIIVAGQSNIDGRVPKASLPETITPPFANIKNSINSTTGSFSSSMSLPTNFGIDFSMYSALNELNEDIYIIKRSEGGTSIDPSGTGTNKWTPWYEQLDSLSKSLVYKFESQIRKCVESNPNTFDIRALVWQQGEGDFATEASGSKVASENYYKNFKCLIAYIRGVVGNERLPVVCGTVSHSSGQYDPRVEAATLKVAEEDPYMICIDMSDATLLDSYHFDADSAIYFGYKAYDALIDLGVISGTKINPTPPWED